MDKNYNYRWTKGFGIAILIFIILLAGAAFGQSVTSGSVNTPSGFSIDLTTGNLIGYDSSLKTNNGWTSTSGSSGGWVPYGSPQGSFNATDGYTFSYVGEEMGVSGVSLSTFPHGYQNTSAVFVTGFMYGLKYRFPCANSIGGSCENLNGPQDTLRVEVGYYPATGPATFYLHQLGLKNQTDGNPPYNMTWQTLAETVTFAGAKPLAQAGSVNMGIYGMDAGFWACLMPNCYGPQVKDAYIRANYSVDPCILNPAYNPSCPGFNDILQGALSPLLWNNYNIATALPHIGGGVQLHGFDYGFGYYAGDYCTNTFMFWCTSSSGANGRNVSLNISDKFGNSLFTDNWWVEGNYSGGSRSGRMLFTETKNTLNMGYVTWNAYGGYGDNMGLAFYTRPIWTPDPCYEQPLYSKNCSNFDAEIKRLADEQKQIQKASLDQTVANISTTSPTPSGNVTNTVSDANTSNPTVSTTTVISNETTSTSSSPKASSNNTTTVTEVIAPRTESRESNSSSAPVRNEVVRDNSTTSYAMSLISRNQERETNIAMTASQNAIKEGEQRGMQSMRTAEKLALDQVQRSNPNNGMMQEQHSSSGIEFKPQTQSQTLAMLAPPVSTSVVQVQVIPNFASPQINQQTVSTFNTSPEISVNNINQFSIQSPTFQQSISSQQQTASFVSNTNQQSVSVVAFTPVNIQQTNIQQNTNIREEQTKYEVRESLSTQTNFITDRTNPVTELVDSSKPIQVATTNQTTTSTVKSNVQDNDAAAGVSIANIARTPVGFNNYMVALTDVAFYAPKEIYRNQKNVDNARALRQLASDRLHQQMVDQQYLPR
jgi:hypothetical protein